MNLEDLQSARNRERRTDSLQSLPDSFYDDAAAFVSELRARRDEVAAATEDPFDSPEVRRLTNSIKTAENTVEAIYERRVGKVVKLASLDAAGMTADDDGLTSEERELFGALTDAIEHNRRRVIDGLAATDGESQADDTSGTADEPNDIEAPVEPTTGTDDPDTTGTASSTDVSKTTASSTTTAESATDGTNPADTPTPPDGNEAADAVSAADVMGAPAGTAGSSSPSASETEPDRDVTESASGDTTRPEGTADGTATATATNGEDPTSADHRNDGRTGPEVGTPERETVRITRDVGEIVGIDERVYDLASEDVVTLPAANAGPLIDRDAAERLD